ncbi:hypothetical protein TWF730_000017 [Orbilia blumenaviensis]|uniref:Uncharacterized protein n=1 Tax=Orbilia blumenaviensis TaxID=1796055 RepID=A0AAV9VK92_9PEZI
MYGAKKMASTGERRNGSLRSPQPKTPSSKARKHKPVAPTSPTFSDTSDNEDDVSNDEESSHESLSSTSSPQLETEEFGIRNSDQRSKFGNPPQVIIPEDVMGTEKHRRLLDKIDKLRELGVNKILALPQLVVTGDQSSGKSSVLEALTRIPFPRSSGLCTRFATEICLRRSIYSKPVIITIKPAVPRHLLSEEQRIAIDAFRKLVPEDELTSEKFLEVLNEASDVMGVPQPGHRPDTLKSDKRGFSDHLLSLELSGPQHAQFSVIDLPGLIRSVANKERRDDIQLIREMNVKYIKDERSIILAVLSANVDAANQEVLQLAKDADNDGERTLGILTKPDRVDTGAESEVINTANNKIYRLNLGYFVVRNRGPSEMELTAQDRDEMERAFFTQEHPWNTLPKDRVGVASLKEYLGKLIYARIRNDIPQVQSEIEQKIKDSEKRLNNLGSPRGSASEQRFFLTAVEVKAREITNDAFNGRYQDPMFRQSKALRLRQQARALNREFAEAFIKYGNTRAFSTALDPGNREEGKGGRYQRDGTFVPNHREDYEILQWIQDQEEQSRGPELPTLSSAYIHSTLFHEITENWEPIAGYYFEQIKDIIRKFHVAVMGETCFDEHVRQKLSNKHSEKIFEMMGDAEKELKEMIAAERTSILQTENPDFINNADAFDDGRLMTTLESVPDETPQGNKTPPPPTEIRNRVLRNVRTAINANQKNSKIINIHDDLRAYYRIARRRIVDSIIIQIFERKIMRKILDLYSPEWAGTLTDTELDSLANEPRKITQERQDLAQSLKTLKLALFTLE